MQRALLRISVVSLASVFAISCGKKKESKPDSNSSNPEVSASTGLAKAYPSGLAISVLPQTDTQSNLFANSSNLQSLLLTDESQDASVRQKTEESNNLITGKSDDCLPVSLKRSAFNPPATSCYEFDVDMLYTKFTGSQVQGRSPLGTLNGLDNLSGEACTVAFARAEIAGVVNLVERSTGHIQAMICQATKNGKAKLPQIGEKLDLKSDLNTVASKKSTSISLAEVTRLADQDGRPVYRTEVVLLEEGSRQRKIGLIHSPGENSEIYNGTLFVEVSKDEVTGIQNGMQNLPNGAGQQQEKKRLISVNYSRSISEGPRLRYELRTANVNTKLVANAFSADGILDLNVGAKFDVPSSDQNYGAFVLDGNVPNPQNSAVDGIRFVAVDINPSSEVGKLSYWQNPGGNYTENARGMIFEINATATGIKGCATTGSAGQGQGLSGVSIRKALKENLPLQPQGFYHPFNWVRENGNLNNQFGCSVAAENQDSAEFESGVTLKKNAVECGASSPSSRSWARPKIADESLANDFYSRQTGRIVTRQCFTRALNGKYGIDNLAYAAANENGFELISTLNSNNPKLISAPVLDGVKPIKAVKQ